MTEKQDATISERSALIQAIADAANQMKNSTDRVATYWSLKRIKENIGRLEEIDRQDQKNL